MATIKVGLRHSTIEDKAGTVFFRITHLQKSKQITTSLHLLPTEWDATRSMVVIRDERTSEIQAKIDREFLLLRHIICDLNDSQRIYSIDDVIDRYNAADSRVCILSFMERRIVQLKQSNRLGTARNYKRAMDSLAKFLGKDIPFDSLTEYIVDAYNLFLIERGIVRNSISFHMRILRAVYNRAVKQHLIRQTFPFQNVYTGIDQTRKKAVDEKIILKLFKLDLRNSASLSLTRDVFIFSYCTRGMAFVDMAYLLKTDIRNGSIYYARHKTKCRLCVRIEPCIKRIIDRYVGNDSPYVFPILKTIDPVKAFSQYQTALNYYNRQLKRLSGILHLKQTLSSYTARHSWAMAARNRNIPLSVISASMGHTSERTTQIYLTMVENSAIDSANRKIIAEFR